MEAIIFYLCKVATFQKEVTYIEWCVATSDRLKQVLLYMYLSHIYKTNETQTSLRRHARNIAATLNKVCVYINTQAEIKIAITAEYINMSVY